MSKIFVISYSGGNSNEIEQAVKSYASWFHFGKDTYLVAEGTATAKEIRTNLERKIAQGKEKLLILEVSIKEAEGWLLDNEWDWLKSERAKSIPR